MRKSYYIVESIEEINKLIEKNQVISSKEIPGIINQLFYGMPVILKFINFNTLFSLFAMFKIPFNSQEIYNRLLTEIIIIRDKNYSHLIAVPYIKPLSL